jgi:hypothetical protein
MGIFDSTVWKRRKVHGSFHGKPFRDLARFMAFVGLMIYVAMLLILIGSAPVFLDTR